MPVGKPAPPRPRRPEFFISSMMPSRPRARIAAVPSQFPRMRAAARFQGCVPYRFWKMRSLSESAMVTPAPRR